MKTKLILELTISEAKELIEKMLREAPGTDGLSLNEVEVLIKSPETQSFEGGSLSFQPAEVGIVIALDEEFREIFRQMEPTPIFIQDINQYFYVFDRVSDNHQKYRCVATFIGGMGTGNAAIVGDRLINYFRPATIVNIGIAGSMDKDVLIGDVILAEQADDYLYAAKAIADKDGVDFNFQLCGDPYKGSPVYIKHAQNLKYAYNQANLDWLLACETRLKEQIDQNILWGLLHKGLIREQPVLTTGDIASGSIVGATNLFVNWLKNHRNRKYLAIEMEAAGIMNAAYTRGVDTLIIRGISDFSDLRKTEFDNIGSGVLRRYAMSNAIGLLWVLMDLKLLKFPDKPGPL